MDSIDFFYINSINDKIPENKHNVCLKNNVYLHNNIKIIESIKDLPNHITHLKLCNHKKIINLPNNLKCLEFDVHSPYNEPLTNLPNKLETLILGKDFNQELENLPDSLKTLKFSIWSIYDKLLNKLPKNLENLTICHNYNEKIPLELFNNFKEITLIAHKNDYTPLKEYKYIKDLLIYRNNKNIKLITKITNYEIIGRLHEEVLNE